MRRRASVVLILVLAAAMVAPAGEVNLANEVLIFSEKDDFWEPGENMGLGCMRLSPDGKKLLYIRFEQKAAGPQGRRGKRPPNLCRLVLRDLETREDTLLPMASFTWEDPLAFLLSKPVFDKDSRTLVMIASTDANRDGVHQQRTEVVQPVVYDIASGGVRKLGISGQAVVPMFDRTGNVVVGCWNKRWPRGKMFVLNTQGEGNRELNAPGIPLALNPTRELAVVYTLPSRRSSRTAKKKPVCSIYDLQRDRLVARLPVSLGNTKLDDISPQWTRDGRYLYYIDVHVREQSPQLVTRIWETTTGKQAGVIEEAYPVGPGPGNTMVLASWDEQVNTAKGLVHDPGSGETSAIRDVTGMVIYAGGGKVLFARKAIGRTHIVYLAEIEAPAALTGPPQH